MPEKLGDKIQSAFKTLYDVADHKYMRPLKRQVLARSSPNSSPRKSPIKSPPIASTRAYEGKVRFEEFTELPLKRRLQEQQERATSASPYTAATQEVNEFKLRELKRERDALREQVSTLANFNYAREPEFVRDRMKLREISQDVERMIRHLQSKHLEPVVSKVAGVEDQLAGLARRHEEASELMAKEFLEVAGMHDESAVNRFISEYVNVRKEASKNRIIADRLAKERNSLKNLHAGMLS